MNDNELGESKEKFVYIIKLIEGDFVKIMFGNEDAYEYQNYKFSRTGKSIDPILIPWFK